MKKERYAIQLVVDIETNKSGHIETLIEDIETLCIEEHPAYYLIDKSSQEVYPTLNEAVAPINVVDLEEIK